MSGQRWPDCDPDVQRFVLGIVGALHRELSTELVGIYLHGSLAMGSYYPPKSDVDLLVVVNVRLTVPQRAGLAALLVSLSDERPTVGDIELSVVTQHSARSFEHPLPYEVHFSAMWKERIRRGEVEFAGDGRDPDLAAHVTSVRERGVALLGPNPGEVFAPVPDRDFHDSVMADLAWIVEGDNILETPFYAVLNGCRMLMSRAEPATKVPSKDEAGDWALEHVPDEHRVVVREALDAYRSTDPVTEENRKTAGLRWDRQRLLSFRDFLKRQLFEGDPGLPERGGVQKDA